jgi:cell surface protein SprA
MFVHEEQPAGTVLNDNDLSIFVRLGSDYKENYYEYELPLKVTPEGYYTNDENGRLGVWPLENNVEIVFADLQDVKVMRNNAAREAGSTVSVTMPYTHVNENGTKITVMGNPNVSNIKTIMIGVRNPSQETNPFSDDGMSKTAEIWVNELRLTDFNEDGGWAAKGKVELQMADLATVSVAGYTHTPGFGSIEKRVGERYQETVYQYDLTSQVQMGKFFNNDYGVKLPVYFGYSENYELQRQIALNYLAKGDYKNAQVNAQSAYDISADWSTINTLAFCALANNDSDKYKEMYEILASYNKDIGDEANAMVFSDSVLALRRGKATVQQLLEKGGYDVND